MIETFHRISRFIKYLVAAGSLICAILFSHTLLPYARIAAGTILYRLFPALFLNLFLSALILNLFTSHHAKRTRKNAIYIGFLIALCCGCAGVQSYVISARRRGEFSVCDAKKMLYALRVPSPALCVAYLGRRVFEAPLTGLAIYLSACLASLIFFLLLTAFPCCGVSRLDRESFEISTNSIFSDALFSSCKAFIKITSAYFFAYLLLSPLGDVLSLRRYSLLYALFEPIGAAPVLLQSFGSSGKVLCAISIAFGGLIAPLFSPPDRTDLKVRHVSLFASSLLYATLSGIILKIAEKIFHFL